MSASEKLKTLEQAVYVDFPTPTAADYRRQRGAESLVLDALPQIMAVVEAAETGRDHSLLLNSEPSGVEMVGWHVLHAQALQAALAALEEQLGDLGSAPAPLWQYRCVCGQFMKFENLDAHWLTCAWVVRQTREAAALDEALGSA